DALAGRVRGDVVLDVHSLAQLGLVEGRLSHRAIVAGSCARAKILDQVGHQLLTILQRPVPRPLRPVAEEAVSVRLGRAVVKLLADHLVDTGVPHFHTRGLRRQEVLVVSYHARAPGYLASASQRVTIYVC